MGKCRETGLVNMRLFTQYSPDRPVERYSYDMSHPMMEGDLEPLANYAGQSVGLVKNIQVI